MSQQERDWLHWLKREKDGLLTQREAAQQVQISDRWVRKLLGRMAEDGDGVVVHKLLGWPSNRRIAERTSANKPPLTRQPSN